MSVSRILVQTAAQSRPYRAVCLFLKLALLNLAVFLWRFREMLGKYALEIVGVGMIALTASLALLTRYMLPGHDLIFHLLRIEGLKDGLLSGVFPVRIQPNWCNGWGYAVSVMYGDTTLLLPALMRMLGFTVQTSYKTFVAAVNLGTAAAAYYSFYRISRHRGASLLGSFLYTACPYRLCCIYVRGAFGEYTAMMFLPLAALGFWYAFAEGVPAEKRIQGGRPKAGGAGAGAVGRLKELALGETPERLIAPVLGFSGLIQTHILTCQMAAILIVILCLVQIRKVLQRETFLYLARIVGWTALVSLWFLIPFLRYFREDLNCTAPSDMASDYQVLGVSLTELFAQEISGYYGYSWSELTSLKNKFSIPFSNGLILCALIALTAVWARKIKERRTLGILLGLGVLALWLSTNLFPYHALQQHLPKLAGFLAKPGLPYRYLSLACLLLSVLAAVFFGKAWESLDKSLAAGLFCAVFVIGFLQSMDMSYQTQYSGYWELHYDGSLLNTENLMGDEYLYRGSQVSVTGQERTVTGSGAVIEQVLRWRDNGLEITYRLEQEGQDAFLEVPLFYYPGYRADSARGRLTLERGSNNRIRVILPGDVPEGTVTVAFREPPLWRLAEWISAAAAAALVCGAVSGKRRRKAAG